MRRGAHTRAEQSAVLEFVDVVKEYKGVPPVRALDGVSLRVDSGELFAVMGQSGSGKSTLLNLAGALDRPTSGVVRIDGHDVSRLSDTRLSSLRGRRIGFVFQQFVLIEGLTAMANVATALVYQGLSTKKRRARAIAALERVGLGGRIHHRPGQLSGGEQQRVAIARALVGEPAVILADEPTGNLDSGTGMQTVDLLRELHRDGATIGVVTHDSTLADELPRVVTIRDGHIESDTSSGGPR
ncbi:ABC transporter ATP-binding protein [Phytoactinopolyspora mesophila]|uniref:ATP-binding cassette domain-containing protein n=1 Tax=Phytoactinopolyspora mesophila TaxID=2650750 RepID=A0A7K3MBC2_9ACTN|nr:ABC transporter ATP-binding protein [Phytoactinopolyspora mesophila]NDL60556.1 ATP-binding cassette domain-containing protein [Phytoactinopolyspora mesophila]